MTEPEGIERLRAYFAALAAGDQDAAVAIVATADDLLALLRSAAPTDFAALVDAVHRLSQAEGEPASTPAPTAEG